MHEQKGILSILYIMSAGPELQVFVVVVLVFFGLFFWRRGGGSGKAHPSSNKIKYSPGSFSSLLYEEQN